MIMLLKKKNIRKFRVVNQLYHSKTMIKEVLVVRKKNTPRNIRKDVDLDHILVLIQGLTHSGEINTNIKNIRIITENIKIIMIIEREVENINHIMIDIDIDLDQDLNLVS